MNWYVLFTKTGYETKVTKTLENLFKGLLTPFIPKKEIIFKNSNCIKKELIPLFPSYVFIKSEASEIQIIELTRRVIRINDNIIRFLYYDNPSNISVREDELSIMNMLLNEEYCVELSKGIIVGSRVIISKGPLIGLESTIYKIDRHNKRAFIDLDFMGEKRKVTVGVEILEKISI